jgi:hypothetical protein
MMEQVCALTVIPRSRSTSSVSNTWALSSSLLMLPWGCEQDMHAINFTEA